MTTASISLIFLTETWLSESISDSEILLGSNFNVVARSDRSKWEHGGVLIAASHSIQTQIIDVKLPQYPFSVACGLLDSIPSFFILIYKPPVGYPCHLNIEWLTDCLNEYLAKIKCLVSNYSPTTTVNIYVLGDFNHPGINWETFTSINSREVEFLDLLDELNLNQFVSGSTHKGHNTLDLIFFNVDQLPVTIGTKLFSDHYPIFFSCNFDLIDAKCKSGFSRSSFNAQAFNFYLSDLFKFLSFNDIKTLDYHEHWYFYLHESFSQSVKMKKS